MNSLFRSVSAIFNANAGEVSRPALTSAIWAGLALIALLIVVLATRRSANTPESSGSDLRLTLLGTIAGGALGWALGILITPKDSSEQALFGKYETLIGGFVSGFLSSKITTLFNDLQTKGAFVNRSSLSKILCFLAAFFLVLAAAFNIRQYSTTGQITISADGDTTVVAPAKSVQLFAEARNPVDTSVVWSIDPSGIGAECEVASPPPDKCPTVTPSGLFTAPSTTPDIVKIGVLATNRRDRTKVGRIEITIESGTETKGRPSIKSGVEHTNSNAASDPSANKGADKKLK